MKLIYQVVLCGAAIFMAEGTYAAQTLTAPAPATSSAGEGFRIEMHGADGAQFTKVFHDADGKPIDAATFIKAVKGGRGFAPTIDLAKKVMTITLKSATSTDNDLAIHAGQTFPDFHLPTVDHGEASSGKLVGKPTLVDFFFADCVGCIEELPALNAYAAKHPEVNFLAITFDDAKIAKKFVRQRHFEWPVVYDGKPLIAKLGVQDFPTMFLLNAQSQLLASHTGSLPLTTIQRSDSTTKEPSKAEVSQTQLQWLDHWVTGTLAHADSDNGLGRAK